MSCAKLLAVLLLTSGCTTYVPTKQVDKPFPPAAQTLTEPCPELKKIPGKTITLSQLLSLVADNYAQYHQCQAKVNGWNTWYQEQRAIFDRIR